MLFAVGYVLNAMLLGTKRYVLHCKSNTFNFKKQYFYFTTIMFYHKKSDRTLE